MVATDASWRTSATEQAGWTEPEFDDSSWASPRIQANYGGPPWGTVRFRRPPTPAPLLRREFEVRKPVRRARVYVSGLAYHELQLNGRRVGDHVLDPVFTDYDDRVNYVVHVVTRALRTGSNALGVELGRGFYGLEVPNTWDWDKPGWHDEPKLLLQLEIEYADGSVDRVVSDEDWQVARGPRLSDSIYVGETYDARLVQPGWAQPGFHASGWADATLMTAPRGRLTAQAIEPIKVVDTLQPTRHRAKARRLRVRPRAHDLRLGARVRRRACGNRGDAGAGREAQSRRHRQHESGPGLERSFPDGRVRAEGRRPRGLGAELQLQGPALRAGDRKHRAAVADGLVRDVQARGGHLNTGIVGTSALLEVLTDAGHPELAYAVANQRTYPSWGYLFDNGADTLWRFTLEVTIPANTTATVHVPGRTRGGRAVVHVGSGTYRFHSELADAQ